MIINNHYEIGIPVTNKRIIEFMIRKNKYWEPVMFGQGLYIMTFDYKVYRKS